MKSYDQFSIANNPAIPVLSTSIIIPAYDKGNNGLVVSLTIEAMTTDTFSVNANGAVALALKRNFKRCIEVMTSIETKWACLQNYKYILRCDQKNYIVRDTRSSSLALCIGLLNIYRTVNRLPQIIGITGTGIVRIDGSIEQSLLECLKKSAIDDSSFYSEVFITSDYCKHLCELEMILNSLEGTLGGNSYEKIFCANNVSNISTV